MKKTEFLQDSIGFLDDDLVEKAHEPVHKSKTPLWARWTAAAACVALLLGCGLLLLPGKRPADAPQKPITSLEEKPKGNLVAENIWEQDGFTAFSLSYRKTVPQALSAVTAASEADFVTQSISISQPQTVKFERLIAQRYAVYRSETGFVMFYDTVEDKTIDLQERIVGDTSAMLNELLEICRAKAWELHPGFMSYEANRQFLDLYLTYLANGSLSIRWDELTTITLDTSFWDKDKYGYADEEERVIYCQNLPWEIFCKAKLSDDLMYAPYAVSILGIDAQNGICIVAINGMNWVSAEFCVYDVRTDTCRPLTTEDEDLPRYLQEDGYAFRFSADGKIATVVYPEAYIGGGNVHGDLSQRFVVQTFNREIRNYQGESLGVFFLEEGTCQAFQGFFGTIMGQASSEMFISDTNSVLYYKKFDQSLAGKSFYASDLIWYNRLNLHNTDTDFWAFRRVDENNQVWGPIELQGNFVRLAMDDTIAIMERGGSYHAYSLTDGTEVTQAVLDGEQALYAHERLLLSHENGEIYATDIFTGNRYLVCRADLYNTSTDGAFVFAYCHGEDVVSCYNIATLESCRIQLDEEMKAQLLEAEGAALQMSYNQEEKTLLLSYYLPEDLSSEYVTDLDFRSLLSQMEVDDFIENGTPEDPVEIRVPGVSEEIMELFRESVERRDQLGMLSWKLYFPQGLTPYMTKEEIFAWMGVEEPEDYLDVNGVRLVLYEDEDEKLQMSFRRGWLLFDFNDQGNTGFSIEYIKGRIHRFSFANS